MKYIYSLILFLFFISCERTEIEQAPEFPSKLYLYEVSVKSKARLFNDQKEITDKDVIDRFLKINGDFRLRDSSFVSDEFITFMSSDSLVFSNGLNLSLDSKNDSQFIFKPIPISIVPEETRWSWYPMLKYKTVFEPIPDNQFMGYGMLVGYGTYTEFNLSVFEY